MSLEFVRPFNYPGESVEFSLTHRKNVLALKNEPEKEISKGGINLREYIRIC